MSSLGSSYLPEEARPFPAMPASPPGPASPAPSSDTDSYDRDISATYSGRGEDRVGRGCWCWVSKR